MMSLALLLTALLFGGMTLYAFGFAAFLFTALPTATARSVIRAAFPWFYLFVIGSAALGALLWWQFSTAAAIVLGLVALTTLPTRQLLMPAINRATDEGARRRFGVLHGLSVLITLTHIAASGWVLVHTAA